MDGNFGAARFIDTIHGNLNLLVCESRTLPNFFYLYKIKKRGRPGTDTVYYECKRCYELGGQIGRVTVRNGTVVKNPDAGHNELCHPIDKPSVEAIRLKREAIQASKDGKRPSQAYREAHAKIPRQFANNQDLQEQIQLAMPSYSSMRSSLYQ